MLVDKIEFFSLKNMKNFQTRKLWAENFWAGENFDPWNTCKKFRYIKICGMILLSSLEICETHTIYRNSTKLLKNSNNKFLLKLKKINSKITANLHFFVLIFSPRKNVLHSLLLSWILEMFLTRKERVKLAFFSYHAVFSPPKDD